MSIEQKIAELLSESKKLKAEETQTEEVITDEVVTEVYNHKKDNPFKHDTDEGLNESDSEQIDELDASTLKSYKAKAVDSGRSAMITGNKPTLAKRTAGVKTVNKKLGETYEEEEEITIDVSADVAALVNGEDLTEEFKTKAATIFEAAIVTRLKTEVAKIEEKFEFELAEQVEEIKEGLVDKVDGYLNYIVEQWMIDNELALDNGMKTDIMESFIAGMKTLFTEHYIEVPAEKYDLVSELEEQVETSNSKLDQLLASNVELTKQINEMKRVSSIGEYCADLADTDAEKFKGLAEELAFEDTTSFKTKLQTIKENYFGKKATVGIKSPVSDEPVQLDEEVKIVDPVMAGYLKALK